MNIQLIRKYNVPGPRYTSYPTVPYWNEVPPTEEEWKREVKGAFDDSQEQGISLYLHLPFCEKLCTYCGCNKRITINHTVEDPYITALLQEWALYLALFGRKPLIRELHLGGGTPTFFSPHNLRRLIKGITAGATVAEGAEFSFEGHPNNTTEQHLQTLYDLGFRRVSFGIQDFDPQVQAIINRIQPYENVLRVTEQARRIGYTSINYDLIYGLPLQTAKSVGKTIAMVNTLRPDRIAFYSYAHVPWTSPGQRRYTEADLPSDEVKRGLYEMGKEMFEQQGYTEIGMDHFALADDALSIASRQGNLHRNFMGYSTSQTRLMVGLGCSSISDTWTAFGQNLKKVEDYQDAVKEGRFPIFKGHLLNREDLVLRQHILNLMCRLQTKWEGSEQKTFSLLDAKARLSELAEDGLIRIEGDSVQVLEHAKPFVRNVCMALDARLWRNKPTTQIFSKTI
ncbi:oxygen-independent coproporphyrinogen III oxidase [Cesiribacter andamanensis]|uniref:Coproporphyrinogen-III oxidase n=1 Tax=Cesiribacter andamanensis AMV16 TaxID=1279009 RepID=M7N735_9BACT|nr:oxygen-independent coproporphyrinogen III oxidase [Cesiribacter andamanensis]EMR04423.1 Oxygen-independent coproporphyrinogen-III oxidase [Cesiribacter andamanensis AMV16]